MSLVETFTTILNYFLYGIGFLILITWLFHKEKWDLGVFVSRALGIVFCIAVTFL
ncbi:hypothetical protein UACE39S_06024 [Ureibacillus acetophenoni]|uniref:hypothetical protein n=1 Tax=Ureibacillus sp. MALMAid1270 TaxID=3411629 RepID=UPI003BA5EAC6